MTDTAWLDIVLERTRCRNEAESGLHEKILRSNRGLWQKFVYLESCRVSAKHNIAVLEHETADTITRGDFELAARNAAKKIGSIANELQPYGRRPGKQQVSLSKTIYDQRKFIGKLEEELRLARGQISETFNSLAAAQEAAAVSTSDSDELRRRVVALEESLSKREEELAIAHAENKDLTLRIITEKNKSAAELDEMNKLLHRK
jgi:predicted  nucleic acid-binding Zn-ribbon protein